MEQSCIADEKACKQIVKKRTEDMKICIDVEEKDQTKKKERQLIE